MELGLLWWRGSLLEKKHRQQCQIKLKPTYFKIARWWVLWNQNLPILSNKNFPTHHKQQLNPRRPQKSHQRRKQSRKSAVKKSKKFKLAILRLIWTIWNLCRWGVGQTSAAIIYLELVYCKRCLHLHRERWQSARGYLSTTENPLLQGVAANNSNQPMMEHGPWVVHPSSTLRFSRNSQRFRR